MSTPFRLEIPEQLYQEIIRQARAQQPNECCGLLAGKLLPAEGPALPVGRVERHFPMTNVKAHPKLYAINPAEMAVAMREMRRAGIDELAFYHSHPTSKPVPSKKDLRNNGYGDSVVHLIVSLVTDPPLVRGWWLRQDSYEEAEFALVEPDRRGAAPRPPARIETTDQLDDLLSEPTAAAVDAMSRLDGDLLVLGVSGKMGPTLARMARRASDQAGVRRRILGVARFGDARQETALQSHGIETIRCNLLDPAQFARLPDVPNVIFMTGMKFGATGQEALTWAMNCWLPGLVCQKYRTARLVAFSTGNVYGLSPVAHGGSLETDPLKPVGEYALSCLGRERILEHFSRVYQMPVAILRLNYATEMRYGVLVDVARRVWGGRPVELGMGHLNAIWQADASAMALAAFGHAASPPLVLNLAGPELLSVRRVAEQFGRLLVKPVVFQGTEGPDALLSNGQEGHRLFGYPRVGAGQMMHWIADWVARGGEVWDKPTHFEVRDGQF